MIALKGSTAFGGEVAMGTGRPRRHGQWYEICIGGELGSLVCSAFPQLQARVWGGDTVLSGTLVDQAALYGVLAQLEALGLELLEVRRLHGPADPDSSASG
jgi:hypothetical protein